MTCGSKSPQAMHLPSGSHATYLASHYNPLMRQPIAATLQTRRHNLCSCSHCELVMGWIRNRVEITICSNDIWRLSCMAPIIVSLRKRHANVASIPSCRSPNASATGPGQPLRPNTQTRRTQTMLSGVPTSRASQSTKRCASAQ